MKKLICLTLCLLVLCGCSTAEAPETQGATTPSITNPPTEATQAPTEPPTVPPTEVPTDPIVTPGLQLRHPLNGAPIDQPVMNRPFAVVINNIYDAQPLHGISQADIFYEIVAEGGGTITRCLAIYTDPGSVPKIGSVRSARTYFLTLTRAYDAILVHAGGSDYAYDELRQGDYAHMDGRLEYGHNDTFYRDQQRLDAGYALEHTLFTSGESILELAVKKGLAITYDYPLDVKLQFEEEVQLSGSSAKTITLHFLSERGKGTILTYDETLGQYGMTQEFYGEYLLPLQDANNEEPVCFSNVLILHAKTSSDGYRMFAQLTGEGTGYFACNGQAVPITWHRESEDTPFTYRFTDGTPITLQTGRTYIGIVSTNSPIVFE